MLFFSVNGSGHFCGMAQMMTAVDYNSTSSVWSQDKWRGKFKVKWIYVKDVPNGKLRHIRLENNDNKSVTNSRDTQEVPNDKGIEVLQILHSYNHSTSIFDDFFHYERKQEEEVSSKRPPMHVSEGNNQSQAPQFAVSIVIRTTRKETGTDEVVACHKSTSMLAEQVSGIQFTGAITASIVAALTARSKAAIIRLRTESPGSSIETEKMTLELTTVPITGKTNIKTTQTRVG